MTKWRIKDKSNFVNSVFGADNFLTFCPEIQTTGVELQLFNNALGSLYYIIRNGKPISDSAFFSLEEMQYLEMVE